MTTTSPAPAPQYLPRDTYTGKHTVTRRPGSTSPKWFVAYMTAAELAAEARESAVFVSFGHVDGRECFSRNRYVATPTGDLWLYNAEGGLTVIHPADRSLRVLRARA